MDSSKPANLILTGFMATGKSTVGMLVASQIGWHFVDADEFIVARAGMSIPAIFEMQGEATFRRIESDVCRELAAGKWQVIATGGGMLIDDDNRRVMQERGMVICLTATPDTIRTRLETEQGRPLAGNWESLLAERRAVYESFEHCLDTTGRNPQEIAEEVEAIWQTIFT